MPQAKQKLQPSAEVIPILQASCARLKKLLTLCEAEIDALINDSRTSTAAKARQIQILSRTIQGLQKDWLKYMAILHPDVPVTPPQSATKRLPQRDIELMSDEELRAEMFKLIRGENEEDEGNSYNCDISVSYSPSVIVPTPESMLDGQENSLQQASFEGPLVPSSSPSFSAEWPESLSPGTDNSQTVLSRKKLSGNNSDKRLEVHPRDDQAGQSQQSVSSAKRLKKQREYPLRTLKKPPPNSDS